ncbi:MAG: DNA gyrase subunit B [Candidatus Staskawiczbacteria bacterium RIFCSPHIGHO2_02_FULL_33_16]|uniref:DNA topoisomerase (ATP-hydrolyzing) n=1 Tax=Candidatus Staskawiczbacteria bacterium RIFCSPHIGHO2_02_FULL_33_16 TaxID=1802204 RepID=A0A1G2HWY2_9BACT|nr:MAG: DNA gyrase subunit B [Candidatus Staskawiczbacteria bacterium RIFCSPHIGHO2_02_FULL_33_16]OGZ70128.1 MAG: DNA gyrase subunit B [Candidatus Staskawiczbacteria bacterium RIFCSPLOWO2_01_FULL_33_13]
MPEKKIKKDGEYTAKDIYVLKGLEPVRKRPGMYIGSTGLDGLHHLIWEVVDNCIDEAMAGYAKNIEVILLPDNRVKISDDGRGIPVEKHADTGKSALETVMTTLHAGGKFGGDAYKVSGGLHGVGVSVVCALSTFMEAQVERDGGRYVQEYFRGNPKSSVKKVSDSKRSGTTITFDADPQIFPEIKYDTKKILGHLRHQAYLTKGVRVIFYDKRKSASAKASADKESEESSYGFYFEGGVGSFVKYLIGQNTPRHQDIFSVATTKDDIFVEAAFQYTQEMECTEQSFANNIFTPEGGTHISGFRTALTRCLNAYARREGFLKEKDENFTGDDVREGLTAVVSVKIRNPQFEGQTKAKLGNPEAKGAVEDAVVEALTDYLERHPTDARAIIENCILATKARLAAKAARATVLRKGVLEGLALPGKLADCLSKDPEESELYIVEGDSAGGCFFGDTKVALVDGRNISFVDLAREHKEGKKNYCYTIKSDGSIGVELILNPRITKKNAEVVKVILDNSEELICTPDHKFMLRNGSYRMAKDLTSEDSLMPLYKKHSEIGGRITIKGYEMVLDPQNSNWIFTHVLSDKYNLERGVYSKNNGDHKHHIDFNKLNNNPDNLIRMTKDAHLDYHRNLAKFTLHTESAKENARQAHQTKKYKEKLSAIMSTPKMKEMLSERAKKQWESEAYKEYMIGKFLEFYNSNAAYRQKNNALLNNSQKEYWAKEDNRNKQSARVTEFFKENPESKEALSFMAQKQWQNRDLLKWRSEETKKQWTPEFRLQRKSSYNQTYLRKFLVTMKGVSKKFGNTNKDIYQQERLKNNDKSLLKYETIKNRFFNGSDQKLQEAVVHYNHKIKKIEKLTEKVDVYDIEVPGTHNFALASGVFVHNSAKMARDRRFQAILPLKGKILNVERARLDKMLSSKEIKSIIIALGTAVAEDFSLEKLRYHRIIIMTDADVDGSHIRTLLLTLFYRYFKPIMEAGYIYIAQPPLYKIQSGKSVQYAYTEEQKDKIVKEIDKTGVNLQRYKGLGEMDSDQLWETTMNPENRLLLQVQIDESHLADKTFDILMGEEVEPRKKFIQTHAKSVKNLDI